jgi:uncharacterized protein YxjI
MKPSLMTSSEQDAMGYVPRQPIHIPEEEDGQRARYTVREPALRIGDDYIIEDLHGAKILQVDGKLLRLRETLLVRDPERRQVFLIRGNMLDVKHVLTIFRGNTPLAVVRNVSAESGHERFTVDVPAVGKASVIGAPSDRSYTVAIAGRTLAVVAASPFGSGTRLDVQIAPGQDDHLILAIVVCLDVMTRS